MATPTFETIKLEVEDGVATLTLNRPDKLNAFNTQMMKDMIAAFERGDVAEALRLHRRLLPIYTGIFRTQGTILVKAGLRLRGMDVGPVRMPLVDATEHEISHLREDLLAAGLRAD